MASDLNKHKAEMLKIAGFGLIAPFGRIVVQPTVVFKEFNPDWLIGYIIFAFIMTIIGFIFILRSYDMLK